MLDEVIKFSGKPSSQERQKQEKNQPFINLVVKVPLCDTVRCLGTFLPVLLVQVVAPKDHEDNPFGEIQVPCGL